MWTLEFIRRREGVDEFPDLAGELQFLERHRAAAEAGHVLAHAERKHRRVAERADAPAVVHRPRRVRRVLDKVRARALRDLDKRIEVGRLAEEVRRDDSLRALRNGGRRELRIDVEGLGVDVDEHRRRADADNGRRHRGERVGRHDDFVAAAEPHGLEHEVERPSRRRRGHAAPCADEFAEGLLEPHDVCAAREVGLAPEVEVGLERERFEVNGVPREYLVQVRPHAGPLTRPSAGSPLFPRCYVHYTRAAPPRRKCLLARASLTE